MESNLKVRTLLGCSILNRSAKKALGFTYRLATDFRQELYLLRQSDGSIMWLAGNGHIRLSVKQSFKKDFGVENPESFDEVFEKYSPLGPSERGISIKYRYG